LEIGDEKMKCKYCNREMEHDCSCGAWENEVHFFFCSCGASVAIYEQDREPVWSKGDN